MVPVLKLIIHWTQCGEIHFDNPNHDFFDNLLGQSKKSDEKNETEEADSKDGIISEVGSAVEPVPNGTTLGTSTSRGPFNLNQSMKRSASGDPVTKQPPGKKKKI